MSLSKLQEMVRDRGTWYAAVHRAAELDTTEELQMYYWSWLGSILFRIFTSMFISDFGL